MRPALLRALAGVFALLTISGSPTAAAYPDVGERTPLWPTEVTRIAEPLLVGGTPPPPESQRLAALRGLDVYTTPLIVDAVVAALDDPSPQIRREALQRCSQREIVRCVPAALTLWRSLVTETSNRLYALRVILLEPTPEHVDLILAGLRNTNEILRIEAARLLGVTPLPEREGPRIRAALVAKLADPAPEVRRAIAKSLGLLGAPEATLVLARMLEDPDPPVRRDAADALGMIGDPRALPAIERAIDRGDEVFVARALLDALVRQPGEAVDQHLLEMLDVPPRGLTSRQIGLAIGARTTASPLLLDGLLLRVREEALRPPVIEALLWLGDQALPAIEAALARGVESEVALELERLVRARRPIDPKAARPARPRPADGDRRGWHRLLAAADGDPIAAAADLGGRAPPWLAAAIGDALERPIGVAGRRPWLVALASMSSAPGAPDLWARVVAQGADPTLALRDRCVALLALGRAPRAILQTFGEPVVARASDPRAQIRACAALALAGRGDPAPATLLALLLDPSPRVRSAAAIALAAARATPALQSRLALLSLTDDDGRVRAAATWSGRVLAHGESPTRTWIHGPARTGDHGWLAVEGADERLILPALDLEDGRWIQIATPVPLTPAAEAPIVAPPYREDEWID